MSYTYTSATGTLSRATSAGSRTLATDLDSFRFVAYDRDGDAVALDAIDVNTRTKMVQMELRCRKDYRAAPSVKGDVISARYVLRNKASS